MSKKLDDFPQFPGWKRQQLSKTQTKYLVPGPTILGETFCAYVFLRNTRRFCNVRLDYGQIDRAPFEVYELYHQLLTHAAKRGFKASPYLQLWQDYQADFPRNASMNTSGFRWIWASHVTVDFADRFIEATATLYAKARECYTLLGCDQWTEEEWLALASSMFRDWEEIKRRVIGETPKDFRCEPTCWLHPGPIRRSYPRWRNRANSQLYYIHSELWIYEVHGNAACGFFASGPSSQKLGLFVTDLEAKRACESHFAQHGYCNRRLYYRLGAPIDRTVIPRSAAPHNKKRPARPNDGIPKVAELLKNGGRCPVCDYVYQHQPRRYYSDDNGVAHRAFHRQHVPTLEPLLTGFPSGDIRVDRKSPPWLHKLVYERARYLQRQEHYDFVQWTEDRGLVDNEFEKDIHALLLIEQPKLVVGAASFGYRLWTNHAPGWHLNFIWIAGTWRRKNVLSKRWPMWKETYGDFTVEPPWSKSMRAFLLKMGAPDPVQAEALTKDASPAGV